VSELENFEEELKRELRRVEAPDGFADRLMGRVAEKRKTRLVVMPRRVAWMAVAAMLLVGIVLGGWQWRQRQQREQQEAELARRQFDVAMQVTGRTLLLVQEQIGHAGEIRMGTKREVE
jgi:uncharacterized iron-regulated membrane protein